MLGKRRKAIVNANSAVTLGKDNTFLDVKLFSKFEYVLFKITIIDYEEQ
jgi:hypothetical protein